MRPAMQQFAAERISVAAPAILPVPDRVCPHLGLENDAFRSLAVPSHEHRCFLWLRAVQVDLKHQSGFCLGSSHSDCPLARGVHRSFGPTTAVSCYSKAQLAQVARDMPGPSVSPLSKARAIVRLKLAPWLKRALVDPLIAVPGSRRLRHWLSDDRTRDMSVLSMSLYGGKVGAQPSTFEMAHLSIARERPATELVSAGLTAARQGSYSEARRLFAAATASAPQLVEAWIWQAVVATTPSARKGYYERIRTIGGTTARSGDWTEIALQEGVLAAQRGVREWANLCFIVAAEAHPSDFLAWLWLARTATRSEQVVAALEMLISLSPSDQTLKGFLAHARQWRPGWGVTRWQDTRAGRALMAYRFQHSSPRARE